MKAHCDRLGLLNAFNMVASVAPPRSPKPILQNLKLAVDEDGATLMATDLEVGIRHRVLGVEVDSPGSVILPTAKFGSILKAWDDDHVALSTDDQHLHVRGARSKYKLGLEDPELFPESPEFNASSYLEVAAPLLRTAIRRTIFATDVESARYALGGILVEHDAKAGRLTFVATDGRRLARMMIDGVAAGTAAGDGPIPPIAPGLQPVIPLKAAKLLDKIIGGDAEDLAIQMAFDKASVSVRTEAATIHARLVEGRFPRYTDVFPTSFATKIPLVAGSFRRAVEQAAIATADESRGVDFAFGVGILKLSASAADVGAADVELPIDYEGIPTSFSLDPRYILDALATMGPETRCECSSSGPKEAVLFETPDDYSYVAMPLTREV